MLTITPEAFEPIIRRAVVDAVAAARESGGGGNANSNADTVVVDDRLLWSTKRAAESLSISTRTLGTYVAKGEIPSLKVGERRLFDPADLKAWIQKHKTASRSSAGTNKNRAATDGNRHGPKSKGSSNDNCNRTGPLSQPVSQPERLSDLSDFRLWQ